MKSSEVNIPNEEAAAFIPMLNDVMPFQSYYLSDYLTSHRELSNRAAHSWSIQIENNTDAVFTLLQHNLNIS
jgi:hypothetical protein